MRIIYGHIEHFGLHEHFSLNIFLAAALIDMETPQNTIMAGDQAFNTNIPCVVQKSCNRSKCNLLVAKEDVCGTAILSASVPDHSNQYVSEPQSFLHNN